MRLFLASEGLGSFADELKRLARNNKRVLLITNARDHRSDEARKEVVNNDKRLFTQNGFVVDELDLRLYFNKPAVLDSFVKKYKPGCVFCIGGNFYSLATALKLSGMHNILQRDLEGDRYVYGGYSAGAMNAAEDLMFYAGNFSRRDGDRIAQAKNVYGEVFTDGLGLVEEYVLPHANRSEYAEVIQKAGDLSISENKKVIKLKDTDAFVVDGNERKILRTCAV
jgi:dipeptidase E